MRFNTLLIFVVAVLIGVGFSDSPAEARLKAKSKPKPDLISGNWTTSLVAAGNSTFTLTMKLKLEGDKVTGSYESDHVGSGKISKGIWAANKLSLTLETNHGPITLTGDLKQGKLSGKFNSGPMQGTWQANKKRPDAGSGK